MNPDKVIDAKGLICPRPILKLFKAVKEMKQGEVIQVMADDLAFEVDVKAWCTMTHHTFLDIVQEDSVITATIEVAS